MPRQNALPRIEAAPEPAWDWSAARGRCLSEARRLMRNPDDAEEAVQEALARAWRARASCATPEAPLPWLLQITRNEAFRLLDRRRRLEERETPAAAAAEPASEDSRLERAIAAMATEQALSDLRPDERALVRLRYVHDLSQPELARRLDLPEGTVKVRLHRIRGRLRTVFEAQR